MKNPSSRIRASNLDSTHEESLEDPLSAVTKSVKCEFENDGVVMRQNVLHPEWILLLELGLQRVLNNSSQEMHLFFEGEEGEFIETIRLSLIHI